MISDISPVNNYSGNGSATTFDFDFYIEDSSQLKVYKINSSGATIQLSEDIDYSVNEFTEDVSRPNPDFSQGGYITFPLVSSSYQVLASDEKISLQLDIPFEQESEFGNSSLLNLNSLEFSLDYLTRLCQILKRQIERCAKIKEGENVNPDTLSENINLLAQINEDISTVSNAIDDVIVTSSNTENISSVAGSIENVNAVADDLENIDAVNDNKTNIDTVAGSISDVNTVAGSIQDVNSVAGSIADINDVADDLTNIDSVAGDLTNINSVAGDLTNIDSVNSNKTNIDTVAGSIANVNSVAGSITNVNSVAGSISNVNSVAGNISNINAVKNNETNINAVNSNKTNIDTVAGSIANINTTAGGIANVNTVAGSIQDINDVADDLTNINLVAGDLSNIDSASNYADNANVWAEGTDADVQDLGGVHSAKGWAEVAASGQIQADWNQTDTAQKDYIKNKPTIPAAQIQSDWSQSDNTALDFIKNKPTIPTATNVKINGTTITSDGVANIITNSAYNASSNKIATMSDLPADEIFIATYGTTTYNAVSTAYNAGKTIFCDYSDGYIQLLYNHAYLTSTSGSQFVFQASSGAVIHRVVLNNASEWSLSTYYLITHTANTAVGSSTKPIYISSTGAATASTSTVGGSSTPVYLNAGTITSTGLSIASSRFDGQWVASYASYSWTAKGSYTISLSGYLPSDRTSYSYYIYVVTGASRGSSNGTFRVGTVASPATNVTTAGNYSIGGYLTSNSTSCYGSAIIPVKSNGSLYSELTVAMNSTFCYLMGYRRIGTNS